MGHDRRSRHAPRWALLLAASVSCGPVTEGRDATADVPRDQALWDASADRVQPVASGSLDVAPSVDVVPFDASTDQGAGLDAVSVPDAAGCAELADQYAQAVGATRSCSVAGDCSMLACETPCCSCEIYVNPQSDRYADLARLA